MLECKHPVLGHGSCTRPTLNLDTAACCWLLDKHGLSGTQLHWCTWLDYCCWYYSQTAALLTSLFRLSSILITSPSHPVCFESWWHAFSDWYQLLNHTFVDDWWIPWLVFTAVFTSIWRESVTSAGNTAGLFFPSVYRINHVTGGCRTHISGASSSAAASLGMTWFTQCLKIWGLGIKEGDPRW